MTLRLWLHSTRSLLEEVVEWVSNRRESVQADRDERPLNLVTLEDRVVFSATPLPVLPVEPGVEPVDGPMVDDTASSTIATETEAASSPQSSETKTDETAPSQIQDQSSLTSDGSKQKDDETTNRTELVVVDAAVEDYEQMIDDLVAGQGQGRQFESLLLDSQRDGIEQISAALAKHDGLDALHIVSHGTNGRVQLGNGSLDSDNLDGSAGQIAKWGSSLTSEADILFYVCDLANNEDGRTLVESLAALTSADTAASSDETGHEELGGDWDLEFTVGSLDTDIAFSSDVQQNWTGLLDAARGV